MLVAEFEISTAKADRLADDAAEDAERLATHEHATQRLDEQTRLYALALAELDRVAVRRDESEQAWAELWKSVAPKPRSPAHMRDWSGRVAELLKARDKLAGVAWLTPLTKPNSGASSRICA